MNNPQHSKSLRRGRVTFKDAFAGVLEETVGGGTRFSYDPDWREEIACCLPVARREHEWAEGLHPFFQHLGPEGWLRQRQARVAHLAEEDDFGLLLCYGGDCIGAVGLASDPPLPVVEGVVGTPTNPGRTISGVQKKLLAVRKKDAFLPAGETGPAPYIAKFNSESIPTLVRNEYLTLRWTAEVLGKAETAEFRLGLVGELNETALLVTRFDRTKDGKKLRLEDFAQILCRPQGRDSAGKYDAGYEDAAQVVRNHSARPQIDLDKLFRRLVVFALIGNCDGHLKNFSLLETPFGLRLAPVYDVVNTALYETYSQTLALTLGGKRLRLGDVTRARLEAFAADIGLTKKAVALAFDDLQAGVKRAAPLLTPPPGESPDGFTHRYEEIVRGACLRIFES